MSSMRVLILGVLYKKQPLHGYDIRRELESWRAEQWANIAYGSIYFALNKMAEEGLVQAVDPESPREKPARIEYTITERGKQEFNRLLREFWWEFRPMIDPFQIAVTFMNCLSKEELQSAFSYRADMLKAAIKGMSQGIELKVRFEPDTPRHIAENLKLVIAHLEAELHWIEGAGQKVEQGDLP